MRAPVNTFKRARTLRRTMSLPEVLLWEHLRSGRVEQLRFRRQHPIGPYVLDFYCPSARLCVEVDGWAHDTLHVARRDEQRDRWLMEQGIRVLRVTAHDVLQDAQIENVLRAIGMAAEK